jgi:hypothetical protein
MTMDGQGGEKVRRGREEFARPINASGDCHRRQPRDCFSQLGKLLARNRWDEVLDTIDLNIISWELGSGKKWEPRESA